MFLDFIITLVVAGLVCWAVMVCVLLVVGLVADVWTHYRRARRMDRFFLGQSGSQFSWGPFVQPIVLFLIFSTFTAILTYSYVTNKSIAPSWTYGLVGFLITFCFIIFGVARLSVPEARLGASYGAFAGFVAYAVFYNYPRLVRVVPGAIALYDSVIRLTGWLLGIWPMRLVLYGISGLFVLACIFYGFAGVSTLISAFLKRSKTC